MMNHEIELKEGMNTAPSMLLLPRFHFNLRWLLPNNSSNLEDKLSGQLLDLHVVIFCGISGVGK